MGKYIGSIYKHSQYQLSTKSIKEPVFSFSYSQTSSSIKLSITSVSSVIDKEKPIPFCVPKIPSVLI